MKAPSQVLRSAGTVSIAVALSRITGLAREMVMARLFGAGQLYDAYLLAFRIPNLTRDLFAEGALSSAFVPVFSRSLATEGPEATRRLMNGLATALFAVVTVLSAAGILLTPWLVRVVAPGYAAVPGKYELAVRLARIMFPFLVLISLAALAMGTLNACRRFAVPALASLWFNVCSVTSGIGIGYFLAARYGVDRIEGMAWGVLVGGVAQFGWQLPSLYRTGFLPRPTLRFDHPGLRAVAAMMGPALLGNAGVQINVLVNTNLASSLTDAAGHVLNGPVSWLGYAFRFMQLPLGVFGVALASATATEISHFAAVGRMDEFRRTLSGSLRVLLALTIPSSVGLAVLGESMIGVVYQSGRFTAADTHQTALALACYSVGLAAYSAIKLLVPAFYALGMSRIPMAVSLGGVVVNYAAATALAPRFGHLGLALSTSVVALLGAACLLWLLEHAAGPLERGKLAFGLVRILAASAAMGCVCWWSSHAVHLHWAGRAAHFTDVAVTVPLGVGVYYLAGKLLRAF